MSTKFFYVVSSVGGVVHLSTGVLPFIVPISVTTLISSFDIVFIILLCQNIILSFANWHPVSEQTLFIQAFFPHTQFVFTLFEH